MKIERESSVALYVQIADRLARDIAEGRYKPFQRLPSEQSLMERFGVSRVTVREAIALLARQGLVVAKQGKGTFVGGPVVHHELQELRGFYDALVIKGHTPQTRLLKFEPVQAPAPIELALGAAGREVMFLRRVYSLHGHPFALASAWLPPAAAQVSWDQASRHPIYSILEELLGLRVTRAEVSILARTAEAEEAELLALPERSPVLVMERVSYSAEGAALECSRFSIRPENYRFSLSVQGPLAITRKIQEVAPARPTSSASQHRRKK
ncbi:MAG: GntR family transcriptional regulator [Pseudomonadota bacterium]